MSRRWLAASAIVIAVIAFTPALQAYLRLGYLRNGQLVGLDWNGIQPIRYNITNRDVPGVTAAQLQTTVARSFAEWTQPTVTLTAQFGSFTNTEPHTNDGVTVIGFQSNPQFDRTLGSTRFEFDAATGAFKAADIFINSIFPWSVAPNGDPARWDVESIMVHEVGHLLGLGHSAIGETSGSSGARTILGKRAVMFPIAFARGSIADRSLEADDIAGITEIYGTAEADRELGAISGRVTLSGAGVFGAHVTAMNIATGDIVGNFTLNSAGDFVIAGLSPGLYVVRAEPLDDADIDGFFDENPPVNLNFRATYHNKHVAVPAGGTSGNIEIKVRAK
jgi:hypothetical protein